MNEEILLVADSVSNEKDLPKDTIFEAIEFALASAGKKRYKEDVNVMVDIDQSTGDYLTFRYKDTLSNLSILAVKVILKLLIFSF